MSREVVMANFARALGADVWCAVMAFISPAERAYGSLAPHFVALQTDPCVSTTTQRVHESYALSTKRAHIDGVVVALALACAARRHHHALMCERAHGYRVGAVAGPYPRRRVKKLDRHSFSVV